MVLLLELLDTLRDFQTIIGAFLGGFFALLVALVVAGSAQRRAERIAAQVVMSSLADFSGTAEMWLSAWERVPDKQKYKKVFWIGDRVLYGWPFVAGDFDSARATLMHVDWELGGRLDVLQKAYKSMLDARSQIFQMSHSGKLSQEDGVAERHFTLITLGLEQGAIQANACMPLVGRLFLSGRWRMNRILRRFELLFRASGQADKPRQVL